MGQVVQASREIRELIAGWFESGALGDAGWRDRNVSTAPDLRIIGTDPEECLQGGPAFAFLRDEAIAVGGKLAIVLREVEGYAEGSVGWGVAAPEITLPDGSTVTPR